MWWKWARTKTISMWQLLLNRKQIIRVTFVAIKKSSFLFIFFCLSYRISIVRILHPQKNTWRIERRMMMMRKRNNPISAFYEKGMIFHCLEECSEEKSEHRWTLQANLRINNTLHRHWLSIVGDHYSRRRQRGIALRLIAMRSERADSVHWHRRQEEIRIRTGGFHHAAIATFRTLQKAAIGETLPAAIQRTLVLCRTVMLSAVQIRVGRDWYVSFDPDLTAALIEIGLTTWWCWKTFPIRRRFRFGSHRRIVIDWRRWLNLQQLQ